MKGPRVKVPMAAPERDNRNSRHHLSGFFFQGLFSQGLQEAHHGEEKKMKGKGIEMNEEREKTNKKKRRTEGETQTKSR